MRRWMHVPASRLTRGPRMRTLTTKQHQRERGWKGGQRMAVTLDADTTFLRTLPGRYYYDPALYAAEQGRIFSRLWVCIGRAEELPEPGMYRTFDLANENVLLL